MTLSFDATVRAHNLMWERRLAAGWDCDPDYGWGSPCGTTESDWEDAGYPFPEDPEFVEWFMAFHHYDALENGTTPDPFPHATPEQRLRWAAPSVSLTPPV